MIESIVLACGNEIAQALRGEISGLPIPPEKILAELGGLETKEG